MNMLVDCIREPPSNGRKLHLDVVAVHPDDRGDGFPHRRGGLLVADKGVRVGDGEGEEAAD